MIYKSSASPFNEEKNRSARIFTSSPKGFLVLEHGLCPEQRSFVFHSLIIEQMESGLNPRRSTVIDGAQPDSDERDVLSEQDIFIVIILPSETPRCAASQFSEHRTGPLNILKMCSLMSNSNFSRHSSLALSIASRSIRLVILQMNPKVNAMFHIAHIPLTGFGIGRLLVSNGPVACCIAIFVVRLKMPGDLKTKEIIIHIFMSCENEDGTSDSRAFIQIPANTSTTS